MTITRTIEGKEFTFELTRDEMRAVYNELQHEQDIAYCADAYAGWDDEEIIEDCGVNRAHFEAVLDTIADEMRWRIETYGGSEESARYAAIREVIYDEYGVGLGY